MVFGALIVDLLVALVVVVGSLVTGALSVVFIVVLDFVLVEVLDAVVVEVLGYVGTFRRCTQILLSLPRLVIPLLQRY